MTIHKKNSTVPTYLSSRKVGWAYILFLTLLNLDGIAINLFFIPIV